jgi:hypothetical protein
MTDGQIIGFVMWQTSLGGEKGIKRVLGNKKEIRTNFWLASEKSGAGFLSLRIGLAG